MNQSETIAKLAEALAKAQLEMKHAHKSSDNPFFKSKYADLSAIIEASRPLLAANGLSVMQIPEYDEAGKLFLITQLSHSSGEWVRGRYPITPVKNDPQGVGSAITYARRYSYSAMVGVAADDDYDGNAASNVEKNAKPVFKNASLRNLYFENTMKSFENAENVSELNEIINLCKPKLEEMRESGNEHDEVTVDEINKRYRLRLMVIKEKQQEKDMDESFRNAVGDA